MAMEGWESLTWGLDLGAPPQAVAAGRNAHGFDPVDRYRLHDLWSLHLYGYHGQLKLGNRELPIRPGHLGITPPDTPMEFRYLGISVHLYVHFRVEATDSGTTRQMCAMQDLGAEYDGVYHRLYAAISQFATTPARVNAHLWDLLWERSTVTPGLSPVMDAHPAVRKATELIERHLDEALSVERLAESVGVSYGYLARLFQDVYGTTVVGYVRQRRMERAAHLLERSTLPIKMVAASVGIADLQHFNKAVRATFGVGPRELRERSPHNRA